MLDSFNINTSSAKYNLEDNKLQINSTTMIKNSDKQVPERAETEKCKGGESFDRTIMINEYKEYLNSYL